MLNQLVSEGLVALTWYSCFEAARAVQILHDTQWSGKRIGISRPPEATSGCRLAQMTSITELTGRILVSPIA